MKKANLVLGFILVMLLVISSSLFTIDNSRDSDGTNDFVHSSSSVSVTGNDEMDGNETDLSCPVSPKVPIEKIQRSEFPGETILHGNYPNPLNPSTIISFDIKKGDSGELSVYNSEGQMLDKQKYEAGSHKFIWDGLKFGSGLYFYKLKTTIYYRTGKLILLK